nr:hypothetical protein [Entomobacter blattae]
MQANKSVSAALSGLDNTSGLVLSQTGDIVFTGTGQVSNSAGTLQSGASIAVSAASLSNIQGSITADTSLSLFATQSLDNSAGQIVSKNQDVTLTAGPLINLAGLIQSVTQTSLSAQQLDNTKGSIASKGQVTVTTTGDILNPLGVIYGVTGNNVTSSATLNNASGQIGSGSGALSIAAKRFNNTSGKTIAEGGTLFVAADTTDNTLGVLQAQDRLSIAGQALNNTKGLVLTTVGDIVLGNPLALDNTNGTVQAADLLDITLSTHKNEGGTLYGKGGLKLAADSYSSSESSTLSTEGILILDIKNQLDNEGKLLGDGGVVLQAGNAINGTTGSIASQKGNISITASQAAGIVNQGKIQTPAAGSEIRFDGISHTNSGQSLSAGTQQVDVTKAFANTGQMSALGGPFTFNSGSVSNTGLVVSSQSITGQTSGDLSNNGIFYAPQTIDLTAGGTLTNQGGQIGTDSGDITLNSLAIDNSTGKVIAQAGNLNVTADTSTLNRSGLFQAGQNVALNSATLDSSQGTILAQNGTVTLGQAQAPLISAVNDDGRIQAKNTISIFADMVSSIKGIVLSLTDRIGITASPSGQLNNAGGILQAGTDITLHGGSYSSDQDSTITAPGQGLFDFAGNFNNRGQLVTTTISPIQTGNFINGPNAIFAARTGDLVFNVAGSFSNTGTIEAVDKGVAVNKEQAGRNPANLAVFSSDFSNNGLLRAQGSTNLTIAQGTNGSAGQILALSGPVTLTSQGNFTNAGTIGSTATLAGTIGDNLYNSGTLYGQNGVTVKAANDFANTGGQISAANNNIDLSAVYITNSAAGIIVARQGQVLLTASDIANQSSSTLQAQDQVVLNANMLHNDGGTILSIGKGITLGAANDNSPVTLTPVILTNIGGIFQSVDSITATLAAFDNTNGTLRSTNGAIALSGPITLANDNGSIQAAGSVNLNASSYNGDGASTLQAGTDLNLALSGDGSSNGKIIGQNVTLTAHNFSTGTDSVIAARTGETTLTLSGDLNNAGTIETIDAGHVLALQAANVSNTGSLLASGAGRLTLSGTLANTGEITGFKGPLALTGAQLINEGSISSGQNIAAIFDKSITNSGVIYGVTGLKAATSGALDNSNGQIGSDNERTEIQSASITNQSGKIISRTAGVALTTGMLANNNGIIQGQTATFLTLSGLDNTNGLITTQNGGLSITGASGPLGNIVNQEGHIQAIGGNLDLSTARLDNANGTLATSTGDITLTNGGGPLGALTNTNGKISSGGSFTLAVNTLDNLNQVSAKKDLTLSTPAGFSGQALFSAGRNVTLSFGGDYTALAGYGIVSGGDLSLQAANITNQGAFIAGGAATPQHAGQHHQ